MVFQWLYCDDDSIKIDENGRNEWFYILNNDFRQKSSTIFHDLSHFSFVHIFHSNPRNWNKIRIMYMKIGYIIRIVYQNNQNMITSQNHKILY